MAKPPPGGSDREPRWAALRERAASLMGEPDAAFLCDTLQAAASKTDLELVEVLVDVRLRAGLAEQRVTLAAIEHRYARAVERLDRWVAALMAATWVAGAATVILVASVS